MTKQIGPISFTEAGYNNFKELSKEAKIEKVYNKLRPRDRKYAEQLLKNIPHGNISSGNGEEVKEDNALDATGGSGGHNPDEPKGTKAGKGKRVPKGGESGQK